MSKPHIGIRIPPSLLSELNNYVTKTGTSRTDVIVSAIATYLGCAEKVPLNQRMAELERRFTQLETQMKNKSSGNSNKEKVDS